MVIDSFNEIQKQLRHSTIPLFWNKNSSVQRALNNIEKISNKTLVSGISLNLQSIF